MNWDKSAWYVPRDWLLNFDANFIPIAALIVAICFLPTIQRARHGDPTLFLMALALAVIGIILLFLARLPLYRQRRFFTFGPKTLPTRNKRMYWVAYGFIGSSMFVMLLLLAALR
jgi:uncharacterized membrane protein YidH (DUF202 family)